MGWVVTPLRGSWWVWPEEKGTCSCWIPRGSTDASDKVGGSQQCQRIADGWKSEDGLLRARAYGDYLRMISCRGRSCAGGVSGGIGRALLGSLLGGRRGAGRGAAAGGRFKGAEPLGLTRVQRRPRGMEEGGRMSVRMCRAGTVFLVLPPHAHTQQGVGRCGR